MNSNEKCLLFAENPPNFKSITLKETSIIRFFKVAECQSTAKLIYKGRRFVRLLIKKQNSNDQTHFLEFFVLPHLMWSLQPLLSPETHWQ